MTTTRPTLRTIADRTGVSPATVSRVLSGQGEKYRIGRATRERVLAAAHDLRFVPDENARGLRRQKTDTLGLVIPDVSNPFFARIARAVAVEARARGYAVLVQDSQDQTELEVRSLELLAARRVDGVVLCPVGLTDAHLTTPRPGLPPVVVVDRCFPGGRLPGVASDNAGGARAAVAHLVGRGHKAIGLLQGLQGTSANTERVAGYREGLAGAGIRFDPALVAGNGFDEEGGYEAAKVLLGRRARPTALLALGNMIALGALRAIEAAGFRLPDDLSLVAFDESPFAEHLSCPLTTVAQDPDGLGRLGVKLLLEPQAAKPTELRLPTRLVERRSVGPGPFAV